MIDFLLSFPLLAAIAAFYLFFSVGSYAGKKYPSARAWVLQKPVLFAGAALAYMSAVWLLNLNDIYRPGANSLVVYLKLVRFIGVTPPAIGHGLGIALASVFVALAFKQNPTPVIPKKEIERGSRLIPFAEAQKRAAALARDGKALITWGGLSLPPSEASRHFAISGTTQSGKSVSIKRLMLDVLPLVGKPGHDYRALIYDYKLDFLPFAVAAAPNARVVTFNPFHPDCVVWDIAADVTTPEEARQVAAILVPKAEAQGGGGDSRFFLNSSQSVFEEVIKNLIRRGVKDWTFRDVICAMRDLKRLTKFLRTDKDTSLAIDSHGHEKTIANVFSDVSTYRNRYSIVAALWDAPAKNKARRVSLRAWAEENFIVVLQAAEDARETLDAINRVLLQRAQKCLTGSTAPQPPVPDSRRSWIFLDEATEAGRLDGIGDLLRVGQGYGVTVVLGFQDIDGVRAVYEPTRANELVGLCANKTFLRTDSEPHAEWASAAFGKRVVIREMKGFDVPGQGTPRPVKKEDESYSLTEQRYEELVVLPAEISQIPDPKTSGVLRSYNIIPALSDGKTDHGTFVAEWPLADAVRLFPPTVGGFKPRPKEDQWPLDWDAADIARLKLPTNFLDDDLPPSNEKQGNQDPPSSPKQPSSYADPLDSIERKEF